MGLQMLLSGYLMPLSQQKNFKIYTRQIFIYMQMEKLIEEFIEDMRLQKKAKGTLVSYRNRLEEFNSYLKEHTLTLKTVKNAEVSSYVRTLLQKCQKIATVRNKLSTIRVFMLWAVKNGYMDEVVISADDYPKAVDNKRIRRLDDEELQIFKSYIDSLQPNARAAFWCLYGTGCRVAEAANLRAEDVNLRGKTVYVDIRDAKWGSDRCIPIIDKKAAEVVWKYRAELEIDNKPLFRISKRTIQGYATKFANVTGINFHCHLLRHTFAALLSERNVPLSTIQFLLGHKSLGMTAHYAQSALVDVTDITPEINL